MIARGLVADRGEAFTAFSDQFVKVAAMFVVMINVVRTEARWKGVTRTYSLGQPVSTQLTPDGKAVIFLRGGARDPAPPRTIPWTARARRVPRGHGPWADRRDRRQ